MPTLTPLATPQDFVEFGSNAELVQNQEIWTPGALVALMNRATRSVETRCDRRLAPFTLTESFRAEGVANDSSPNDDVPLDLRSALGRAQSLAFGATALVRDFWLSHRPPSYQDLWTYTMERIQLITAYGGTETIPVGNMEGPQADTGHVRLLLGTFCPPGTTVEFTYSGGYTVSVPDDLNLACVLQAVKFVLIGGEPELRNGMTTRDLDDEIVTLIAPFVRY